MRNNSVDFLRGVAILIMVAANSYPYIFPALPCPMMLRVIFSTAAPIFIFLSGVSLRLSEENGKSILNTIQRIFQILFFAVLIDVAIWNIMPFYTMDVLYLISFSLFTMLFLRRLPDFYALLVFAFSFSLTLFFAQNYNFKLIEIPAFEADQNYIILDAIKHIFIDGWFPVFPWLGIPILGYYSAKYRILLSKYLNFILICGILGLSSFLFFTLGGTFSFNLPRINYMEIFYPVTLPFWIYMIGIFLVVIYFKVKNSFSHNYIGLLGTYSLAVYFFHALLLQFYVPIFDFENHHYSFFGYFLIIASLFLLVFSYVSLLYILVKKTGKKFPVVKFLLGI
ncbi:MAG: heparan-alpha-glucosaminide N-acetyltransferase domain-containing protein [Saprospiraceae bacterium]|nr:heparan-alpha-glucosaminide N-acetyltransferase domain-containing protein [Saprospiraceae bacterium]